MGERERERESCNSRHFSRCLMKSCFPNPTTTTVPSHSSIIVHNPIPINKTPNLIKPKFSKTSSKSSLSSLPDDLLNEILSRVPLSSLPTLSAVCRRWSQLLDSPSFLFLRRKHHSLLHPTLFAFSLSLSPPSSFTFSTHRLLLDPSWTISRNDAVFSPAIDADLSHARLAAVGRRIYFISRSISAIFDPWTGSVRTRSGPLFPRKRFAAATVGGRIYVAGGSARTAAVEEYEPETDEWRVVSEAPRKRYGCIGVGVDGIFYVIGGLKIDCASDPRAVAGAEARLYASSMDLYDVVSRGWLRSRAVPGGGCVVAACGAHGHVYILASHAVELSFWRFNAARKRAGGGSGSGGGRSQDAGGGINASGAGFGEWCRMRGPPLPAQVRLDGTVRFTCIGVEDKVVLIQVMGCIDDLLRRSGRNIRGYKEGLVLIFDCVTEEWSRAPDLPELVPRPACICVEC